MYMQCRLSGSCSALGGGHGTLRMPGGSLRILRPLGARAAHLSTPRLLKEAERYVFVQSCDLFLRNPIFGSRKRAAGLFPLGTADRELLYSFENVIIYIGSFQLSLSPDLMRSLHLTGLSGASG